jgi:hypothetical protein
MKIVPVIKCSDLQRSLNFYTEILDFERKWPGYEDREMSNGVIDLIRDGASRRRENCYNPGVFVRRKIENSADSKWVIGGQCRARTCDLLLVRHRNTAGQQVTRRGTERHDAA